MLPLFGASKVVTGIEAGGERWVKVGQTGFTGMPAVIAYRPAGENTYEQVNCLLRLIDTGEPEVQLGALDALLGGEPQPARNRYDVEMWIPEGEWRYVAVIS